MRKKISCYTYPGGRVMFESGKRRLLSFLILAGCLAILPLHLFAASTGQVKGVLTDKDTGEPIYGASVMVVGTSTGALSDFDGKFLIKRLDPGAYSLRISHLEYNTLEVDNVVITTDLTNEQNFKLSKKVTDIGKVIKVVAIHDILNKFNTSSDVVIGREQIETAPVTTVDELMTQIGGVVTNKSGEVFIRGGRAFEVGYIVDGVPMGDPLGGLGQSGAALSLVSGSIQEFTVIKDGFDPEYGNALSGIVKIKTQVGSKDVTRLNMQYITDDFGNKSLNKYSQNYDYVRFKLSGPDPIFKNKILPALGIHLFEDRELTYFFYAELSKDDGDYQYDRYDSDITSREYSSLNILGFNLPNRKYNNYYWMGNIKFRPVQNMSIILSYKSSQTRQTLFDWNYRYSAQTAPLRVNKWSTLSLEVSQQVNKNMNYEFIGSYSENGTTQKPGDPNNPGAGLEPDQFKFNTEWESFDDKNGNGVYDAPEPIINLFPDTTSYGINVTGADYTLGEFDTLKNSQGATTVISDFRFNENGIVDNLEGEPFLDLNGNGLWDKGDFLHDKNGNGLLDSGLESHINKRTSEPYIDGDSVIGETFTDLNGNHTYDPGVDIFIKSIGPDNDDINHDGIHNGPESGWQEGIPYLDRNGNGLYDSPNGEYDIGEPFTDVNGNGVWDGGGTRSFFDPNTFDEDALWHNRKVETIRGELKLFWQLGNHELKIGAALQKEDLSFQEIQKPYLQYTGRPDGGPYPDRGSFRDMFAYDPWGGQVYFRDKLEYGSMIASLGFRWDFFIQDKNDLVAVARNDDYGSGIILGDRQKFSPRIGFSYPISDKAKVHFNYGHFFQRPALSYMYQRNTVAASLNTVVGNFNLDYMKTIQYSFGVKYAMSENYSLDLSGYFKDEFDKISAQSVRVGNTGLRIQQYINADYGRGRGFEMTLDKRGGGYVNGLVSYTYAFAFGKASQTNTDYQSDFEISRTPLDEAPLDNDVRHSLKTSVQVFIPNTIKPKLFGLPIPNGWSMDVQMFFESGRPFTPTTDYPNLNPSLGEDIQRNSLRMPSILNFDVRFTKDFNLVGLDNKFILQVENIFDNKNVNFVYSSTGLANTQNNLNGIVHNGTAYDNNPGNYDYGRQIRLGIEINL